MDLKSVVPYLEAIINSPDDMEKPVDDFIKFYVDSKISKIAKPENIWSEVQHLAYELERFDPDVDFEGRLAGFFGKERAVKLTKRTLDFIAVMQAAGFKR